MVIFDGEGIGDADPSRMSPGSNRLLTRIMAFTSVPDIS